MTLQFDNLNGSGKVFLDILNAIIGENKKSFIDLGCCHASQTGQLMGFTEKKYIDILPRELDNKEEQKYFEQGNILEIDRNIKYSVSFNLDVIEHLKFTDGLRLLDIMEMVSDKQVLFTPLDAWMMVGENDTDPESHKSLWTPDILEYYFPNRFAYIVMPKYHPLLNIGAFFFWHCENIEQDFERVKNELKQKGYE